MVLHLVIRRDAKISWRHTGSDEVEILVACDATAAEAKRSIARHAGPAGDYDLAFRGQVGRRLRLIPRTAFTLLVMAACVKAMRTKAPTICGA